MSTDAVRQSARSHAFDWYVSALLAPSEAQGDLVTLAAFLGEVGRIPLIVREPALAAIRLQWWHDAVAGAADGARTGNPVADALAEVMRRRAIAPGLVLMPIRGRERELTPERIADEADFTAYLAETWGAAFRLAMCMRAAADPEAAAPVCARAGEAYGLMRLARELSLHLAHGRLPLPAGRFAVQDPRDLPNAEARRAAGTLVAGLAKEARAALSDARTAARALPAPARGALLPLALVEPYLRALEDPGRDPLRGVAEISPLSRMARLWVANLRRRV